MRFVIVFAGPNPRLQYKDARSLSTQHYITAVVVSVLAAVYVTVRAIHLKALVELTLFLCAIRLHGRRGKGMAVSFSREKIKARTAEGRKEGGWKNTVTRLVRPLDVHNELEENTLLL